MKLSKPAHDYYQLICNQRVDEINNRFRAEVKQLISRFQGKPYLAKTRDKAVADFYIKYWENVVQVRIAAFIEAYERGNHIFDNDDIENFLQDIQSDSRKNWMAELSSQEKNELGQTPINFGFNLPWPEILNATRSTRLSIYHKGREKLLAAMRKKVSEQIEGRIMIKAPLQSDSQVMNLKFDEAINSLLKLINNDTTLDKYQKEDAVDALKKLPRLAKEEQTENVIERAKDKLEVVKSMIAISQNLTELAAPYLPVIAQHFHLLS